MKKIISTMCLVSMLVLAGTAFADDEGVNGTIAITDSNASRPGIGAIAISSKSFVTYSGAATAGGYTGCAAGDIMSVVSASSAADPKIALFFAARDSNNPDCAPDNNVYQKSVGVAPTAALVTAEVSKAPTAANKYIIRGAGGGS